MTNQEAIDTIKTAIAQVEWEYPMDYAAAFDMAIKALEKRIPKPIKQPMDVGSHLMGKCTNCFHVLTQEDHPAYCGICGQKVKWE